ncbi:MAG: hemerythrin domain-containing protein [Acidimicrobiia bacterium]
MTYAAPSERNDPATTLKDQHWQIRQYIDLVASADPQDRRDTFEQFASTLEAHEGYEATAVYPVIADAADDAAAIVDARSTEEAAIARQIGELRTSDAGGSQWLADFTFLVAELNAHLSAEENTVLPMLEKIANT